MIRPIRQVYQDWKRGRASRLDEESGYDRLREEILYEQGLTTRPVARSSLAVLGGYLKQTETDDGKGS